MHALLERAALTAPLFVLVILGYTLIRVMKWPREISDGLTRFVFSIALPALLFRMMCGFYKLPPVDARLLIAFFGSCLIVFVLGRVVADRLFKLDGVSGSVFALGGVFSNNAMLGIPLAKVLLGPDALPSVALVMVFNALILWTLVTVSVEWARHGSLSIKGFVATTRSVATNPIVASIISGTVIGLLAIPLPGFIDEPLSMLGQAAAPLSLIALGMGLAEYGARSGWRISIAISTMKLLIQPFVIWGIARLIGLPLMETQAVVLLGSIAVGANVYLMSRQFSAMEGPIATSLVMTTALSAITTPVAITLTAAFK